MFKRFSILRNLALICSVTLGMFNFASAAALSTQHTVAPAAFRLTVGPGETVSQQLQLPVLEKLANGTTSVSYKTVTLTITNSRQTVRAGSTYLVCSGHMDNSNGIFIGQVSWHYDGTNAYHDSNKARKWLPLNGYLQGTYVGWPSLPTGGSSSWLVVTNASFIRGSITEVHAIYWDLYANGNCAASGEIYNQ